MKAEPSDMIAEILPLAKIHTSNGDCLVLMGDGSWYSNDEQLADSVNDFASFEHYKPEYGDPKKWATMTAHEKIRGTLSIYFADAEAREPGADYGIDL
jgi:hypothetical protein